MQLHISGTTRLYGLVGDPLSTAKSPQLLNRLFIEQHADATCIPFWVKGDDLPAFVGGARAMGNLSGMLVTMPHKERMLAFVDELDSTARQVGALNVIRCEADGRWGIRARPFLRSRRMRRCQRRRFRNAKRKILFGRR